MQSTCMLKANSSHFMSIKRININSAVIQENAINAVEGKRWKLTNIYLFLWSHTTLLCSDLEGKNPKASRELDQAKIPEPSGDGHTSELNLRHVY